MRSCVGNTGLRHLRGVEQRAKVDTQSGKPLLESWIWRKGQSFGVTNVGGDDFCAGLENEEPSAVEQFHERAGSREPAFRKKDQPSSFVKEFGHVFHREGRIHVHDKGAAG